MASSNKTPNLDLSQFSATDKPSWLGDYNSDMSKIDTGIATNKASIDGLDALTQNHSADISKLDEDVLKLQEIDAAYKVQIEQNAVAIANLQKQINEEDNRLQEQITTNQSAITAQTSRIDQLVTDKENLQTQITNNQKAITSLQNTDMELSESIQDLEGKVNTLNKEVSKFNLTQISNSTDCEQVTAVPGIDQTFTKYNTDYPTGTVNSSMTLAQDSTGSVFKVYGRITALPQSTNKNNNRYWFDTKLTLKTPPSEGYFINGSSMVFLNTADGIKTVLTNFGSIAVGSDGHIYVCLCSNDNKTNVTYSSMINNVYGTLLINQNFGDAGWYSEEELRAISSLM